MLKLVIFDLDDTLIHEGFDPPILCDDTMQVLDYVRQLGLLVVLATLNAEGATILSRLGIEHYFDFMVTHDDPEDPNNGRKEFHLNAIFQKYVDIHPKEMLWVDDLPQPLETAAESGVRT